MRNSADFADRVAAEIRAEMGRRQVSSVALSEKSGIPNATLSRRLNSLSPFDLAELERVGDALGLLPEEFVLRAARTSMGAA